MKLVESDIELDTDASEAPASARPRPEHRKAYVSLLVTGAVLVATVAVVYVLFPKRNHEVIEEVFAYHRAPSPLDLEQPGPSELVAWTIGVVERPVPWPAATPPEAPAPARVIQGVRRLLLLKRPAAMVRYRVGDDAVTLVAMVPWDAPPRIIVRDDGAERAVWWRKGKWTMIAVGPAATAATWRPAIGAPR